MLQPVTVENTLFELFFLFFLLAHFGSFLAHSWLKVFSSCKNVFFLINYRFFSCKKNNNLILRKKKLAVLTLVKFFGIIIAPGKVLLLYFYLVFFFEIHLFLVNTIITDLIEYFKKKEPLHILIRGFFYGK